MAGDGIVAGSETCRVDVSGFIVAGDCAAAGGPRVGEFLLRFEVCCGACDGDGVARIDIGWLNRATELEGWRWLLLPEAKDYPG
jgi:hypothetical protein